MWRLEENIRKGGVFREFIGFYEMRGIVVYGYLWDERFGIYCVGCEDDDFLEV